MFRCQRIFCKPFQFLSKTMISPPSNDKIPRLTEVKRKQITNIRRIVHSKAEMTSTYS